MVSCFLDSDEQFMIYRRFGIIHARLLLYTQDELRALEAQLARMDNQDSKNEAKRTDLMCREKDEACKATPGKESRKQLLERIKQKTLEYGLHKISLGGSQGLMYLQANF